VHILSNGDVGIGTTSPEADLDLGGTAAAGALRAVLGRQSEGNTSGDGTFLGVRAWGTQTTSYGGKMFSLENSFYGNLNSSIEFYRGGSTTGGFMTFTTNDGTEKMRIESGGDVGIGETNPTAKLHIGGTAGTDGIKFPDGSQQNFAAKCINTYFAITPATRQLISSTTPQVITGLSITLTPKSTNSKFLIMAIVNGTARYVSSVLVYRNGSKVLTHGGNSNESGSNATVYFGDNDNGRMKQMHVHYMDSPNTTASVTYDIRFTSGWGGGTYGAYINDRSSNDMRSPSTLTIMEFEN
jgi:hypothetical protein